MREDRPRVLVVGDVMLDVAVRRAHYRRTPEDPTVPVLPAVDLAAADPAVAYALGGAGNLAANVAALGCTVTLLAVTGLDAAGDRVLRMISAGPSFAERGELPCGTGSRLFEQDGLRTTVKTRYYEGGRLVARVDTDGDHAAVRVTPAAANWAGPHPRFDAVVLTDYGRGVLDAAAAAAWVRYAHTHKVPVFFDPKVGRSGVWRDAGVDVLVTNWEEAADAAAARYGDPDDDQAADSLVTALRARAPGVDTVVVKRGRRGSVVSTRTARHTVPAVHPQAVFDVQGAGDTYLAGLVAARLRGADWADAGLYASAAAGVAVGRPGTAVVSDDDVRTALAPGVCGARGVVTAAEAVALAARLRALGLTVGFQTGCFDGFLHPGHLAVLGAGARACDFLLVGVDADERVARLKGPGRPAVPAADRVAGVAAVRGVGAAFVFDAPGVDPPTALVETVRPGVLIKCVEYKTRSFPEAAVVHKWGGRVVYVDEVPTPRTTERLRRFANGSGLVVPEPGTIDDPVRGLRPPPAQPR